MHEPGIEGGGTVTRYQHKYLYGRMDTKSWAVKDGDKHHDASLDCIFFFLSHHLIPDTHGGWWWWWWWWYTSLATTNDTGVVSSHYTTNETAKNKSFLRDKKKKKENEGSSLSTGDINSKLHKFNVQSRPCFPISRFT